MTYNGWKNRETWNVALWLQNDYGHYSAITKFMENYQGISPYKDFLAEANLSTESTGDGVKFFANALDYNELNDMMWEFSPKGTRAGNIISPR
jgi:hypothetical protein